MKITLDIRELKVSLLFASCDRSRPSINAVLFVTKPGQNPVLVATDGRMLAAIQSGVDQPEDFSAESEIAIDRAALELIVKNYVKPGKKQPSHLTLNIEPDSLMVKYGLLTLAIDKGEAYVDKYPNWRQVVPSGEFGKCDPLTLSPILLSTFAETARILGDYQSGITIAGINPMQPVIVRLVKFPNFLGVQMPMRADPGAQVVKWIPDFVL